ncbi:AAA family ATPase, partial [Promicromonospora citrea]
LPADPETHARTAPYADTRADVPSGPLDAVPGPVDSVPSAGPAAGPGSDAAPSSEGRGSETPRSRREVRESFLTHQQDEEPATRGFRGLLTKVGLRVGPSEDERAERADERAVSQHWPGPRTISMVNGKGGAGKTPSTVLLAAVFAHYGGAGVVTWDNNQTRGTLGWRTEQGPHESTLLDLLPQTDRLLGPSAQAADLARYVHHQTRDRFDVLRSKPIAMANEQRIEPQDVDAIHAVLSKYYRMILIDSGNDESDPMWQRMIDHTDQLVVATTTRDDHAEAGALLLEALATRDGRSAYLAQQAVVVVSQADQKEPAGELERVADGYRSLARAVVTIPFDPAMVDGHLRYGALRPDTRRAWLSAGAAVAGGL